MGFQDRETWIHDLLTVTVSKSGYESHPSESYGKQSNKKVEHMMFEPKVIISNIYCLSVKRKK
jgi:hypothetical protein